MKVYLGSFWGNELSMEVPDGALDEKTWGKMYQNWIDTECANAVEKYRSEQLLLNQFTSRAPVVFAVGVTTGAVLIGLLLLS